MNKNYHLVLPGKIIVVLLLVIGLELCLCCAAIAKNKPVLTVDPGGHKGLIRDLVVSSDGHYLISASDDKTIRVWDVESKQEVRKILGQVGAGSEGKIYAVALSPDDRWLAVGGYLGADNTAEMGDIRIYDFAAGKLQYLLKGHSNRVMDLAFSPDNTFLVSSSFDTTVKTWNINSNFQLRDTLKAHKDAVYAVAVLPDLGIVSAGDDEQLLLWRNGKVCNSYRHSHDLSYIAVSQKWIAVSGPQNDKQILIFDHNLKLHKTIISDTRPSGLAFSGNGHLLLAGTAADPLVSIIYDSQNNFQEQSRFTGHDNTTIAVTFLNDNTAVSGGGNNNDIYFRKNSKVLGHIVGQGKPVWAVALDSNGLFWGNTYVTSPKQHDNPLENRFDLSVLGSDDSFEGPSRITTRYKDWILSHIHGGDYGYEDATLIINKNDSKKNSITRNATNGYQHNCYGFTENGIILSGGMNGFLTAYQRNGKEIAQFIGHTGNVWAVAVKGNRLLSGASDQTIRLWNLDDLQADKSTIYPMLSLFIGNDGEWIAWSRSGYYAASVQGDKYLGFQVNAGSDQEAHFYPASRFKDSLYRPDIIKHLLVTGSEKKALQEAAKSRDTENLDPASILPPLIELVYPSKAIHHASGDRIHLQCLVKSQSRHPITKIQIFVNGRPFADARGLAVKKKPGGSFMVTRDFELPLKTNTITVVARTAYSSSNPMTLKVTRKGNRLDALIPSLYLFGVGVSKYKNPAFNLGYADVDALAVEKLFKGQSAGLYNEVHTNVLTNNQATKNAILEGLDWLKKETTPQDIALIFIAGHGLNEKGDYYFLNHDGEPKNLQDTAVNWRDFRDVISGLSSKVILLADTCHSGAIMGKSGRRGGINKSTTSAVKDLLYAGSGQVIMTASTGSSYSLERPEWGHGAFTKALLEGLGENKNTFKADYDEDQVVTIKEIDLYITQRVKKLTFGKQEPTTIIPNSVPDFPLVRW